MSASTSFLLLIRVYYGTLVLKCASLYIFGIGWRTFDAVRWRGRSLALPALA
jgi:hypothetical protein